MGRSASRKARGRARTGSGRRAAPRDEPAAAARVPAGGQRVSSGWFFGVSLALVAASLLIYAPVRQYPFIGFDDPQYVAENRHVTSGLTWDGVTWAFASGEEGNWHPLTWMSHMADVELFGVDAGAHHLVNVAFHVLNSLLLLLLLVALTGARWPSAMVAALFAVHPMHVESVAWVAERKDVLSTLFWTATLLAYVAYARRPGVGRYLAALGLFAAGLLSKPMVVTLPFVLLLVDLWPLGRVARPLGPSAWWPLVREKLPFFALTVVASVVTFVVQRESGAVKSLESLSIGRRIGSVLVGYQTYVSRLVWPHDMAILYPFPASIPIWQVAIAAVLLVLATVLAVRALGTRPWIAVGWLWFVGTLVPVSGIVKVGSQPFADRYTYIPYTGLFIVIAWGAAELVARRPPIGRLAAAAALVVLGGFVFVARAQVQYWRDGVTLWTHALAVTERNYRAHSALGFALSGEGRDEEAVAQYEAALAINPRYAEALNNLGTIRADQGDLETAAAHLSAALAESPDFVEALANLATVRGRQDRPDDAIRLLERARTLDPSSAPVRNELGHALALVGRLDEARAEILEAIRLSPRFADAYSNLGLVLGDQGELDAAMAAFRQALALEPGHARSHFGLGSVLDDSGRTEEALVELQAAVNQDPDLAEAHSRLARVLVRLGRVDESVRAFEAAVRARPAEPDFHYDLGVMLMKTNRADEAIRQFEEALRLEPAHPETVQVMTALGRIR